MRAPPLSTYTGNSMLKQRRTRRQDTGRAQAERLSPSGSGTCAVSGGAIRQGGGAEGAPGGARRGGYRAIPANVGRTVNEAQLATAPPLETQGGGEKGASRAFARRKLPQHGGCGAAGLLESRGWMDRPSQDRQESKTRIFVLRPRTRRRGRAAFLSAVRRGWLAAAPHQRKNRPALFYAHLFTASTNAVPS